jgi:hypothetical protein
VSETDLVAEVDELLLAKLRAIRGSEAAGPWTLEIDDWEIKEQRVSGTAFLIIDGDDQLFASLRSLDQDPNSVEYRETKAKAQLIVDAVNLLPRVANHLVDVRETVAALRASKAKLREALRREREGRTA